MWTTFLKLQAVKQSGLVVCPILYRPIYLFTYLRYLRYLLLVGFGHMHDNARIPQIK